MNAAKHNLNSEVDNKLKRLKEEFRRWYGMLSVNELIQNKKLVIEIERIEKMLAAEGV